MPVPFLIWQLADSAFPSGGFTHSGGLEAAVRHGDVASATDVGRVARGTIRQAGWGGLPFVRAAHRDWRELPALDALSDLFLNQPVSHRASRLQGLAFVSTSLRVFSEARLQPIADCIRVQGLAGHYAPIFGAVTAALGIDVETSSRLFLFQSGRSVIAAGIKIGIIGMFDGQRLQAELTPEIESTIDCCRDLATSEVAQTSPILDLYQSTHDRLYSRLFQS